MHKHTSCLKCTCHCFMVMAVQVIFFFCAFVRLVVYRGQWYARKHGKNSNTLRVAAFLTGVCVCVCVWERERERERERENFDITSYPEITSISCQDFGYFVPRLDCNFVQDFTLTSYLDSTQYWQFTYTDFPPHYLQPWRTSYTKSYFVPSYQNRYPLL